MIGGLILLGVFTLFSAAVAFLLWDQGRNHPGSVRDAVAGGTHILIRKSDFSALQKELRRRQSITHLLRSRLQDLIDHWPMAFDPEDLKVAQALIDETAEAEP